MIMVDESEGDAQGVMHRGWGDAPRVMHCTVDDALSPIP